MKQRASKMNIDTTKLKYIHILMYILTRDEFKQGRNSVCCIDPVDGSITGGSYFSAASTKCAATIILLVGGIGIINK